MAFQFINQTQFQKNLKCIYKFGTPETILTDHGKDLAINEQCIQAIRNEMN